MSSVHTYFLSITFQPQEKGLDVRSLISKINSTLKKSKHGIEIKSSFKVVGEAKVIVIASVSLESSFEQTVEDIYSHGPVNVECQSLIPYEDFARNIEVAEELLKNPSKLPEDNIFWLDFEVEYHGKSLEQLLATWKLEAEAVLLPRSKGETFLELYKCIAQRQVHAFLKNDSPEKLDKMSFHLPIMHENGHNVHIKCKRVTPLSKYV